MRRWGQEGLFLALCFLAASAIFFLSEPARTRFSSFGLGAPPHLMLALATALGTMAIISLRRGGFFTPTPGFGLRRAAFWAALVCPATIVLDVARPFPATLNQPWPDAWLFYPAIAVVAMALLHLLPLAVCFALTGRARLSIVLAALPEAAMQTLIGAGPLDWHTAAVAVLVTLLGIAGMTLFRGHGILALITVRLCYYLGWHILWGAARLAILPFP